MKHREKNAWKKKRQSKKDTWDILIRENVGHTHRIQDIGNWNPKGKSGKELDGSHT